MQNKSKLISIVTAASLVGIIFTALRVALIFLSLDFNSLIYENRGAAVALYAGFTLFILILYLVLSKASNDMSPVLTDSKFSKAIFLIISLLFLALFINISTVYSSRDAAYVLPIEKITLAIAVPTLFLSFIYYVCRFFSKSSHGTALSLLSMFPVLSLTVLVIKEFAKVSASALLLHYYIDVFSLALLALFILSEARSNTKKTTEGLFPSLFIAFISLVFSFIPDCICKNIGRISFSSTSLILLFIKLVFLVYTATKTLSFIKNCGAEK